MRSRRAPVGRTAASCCCPGRSHYGQTRILMVSSGLAHLSDTGLLMIVRAVIASPFAIKMYSLDFILKPTIVPDSIRSSAFGLRSICQRTHSIPHSIPEYASAHVVSATSPPFERYHPVGPKSVQAQHRPGVPNYPSNGLRFQWCLHLVVENSTCSFLSVLTMPPTTLLSRPIHFQRDHPAQSFLKWLQFLPFLHLLLLR